VGSLSRWRLKLADRPYASRIVDEYGPKKPKARRRGRPRTRVTVTKPGVQARKDPRMSDEEIVAAGKARRAKEARQRQMNERKITCAPRQVGQFKRGFERPDGRSLCPQGEA